MGIMIGPAVDRPETPKSLYGSRRPRWLIRQMIPAGAFRWSRLKSLIETT
jgi:hypothetical protein